MPIIQDFKGKIIFEQKNVEVPADWSMTATNIVASKYLHGLNGTSERESGVRALITRVAESIRDWGIAGGLLRLPLRMLQDFLRRACAPAAGIRRSRSSSCWRGLTLAATGSSRTPDAPELALEFSHSCVRLSFR